MRPLVILAGVSSVKETRKELYRRNGSGDGSLVGEVKAALPVGGMPLLERAVRNYDATRRLAPIHVWGPREVLDYVPRLDTVVPEEMENSLGDKVRALARFDGQVHVATGDIVPTERDLHAAIDVADHYPEYDFVGTASRGESLVALGFRESLNEKMYRVEQDGERLPYAYSSFWTVAPQEVRTEKFGQLADLLFPYRGQGLNFLNITLAVANALFRIPFDEHGAPDTQTIAAMAEAPHYVLRTLPGAKRALTTIETEDFLAHFTRRDDPARIHLDVIDAPSLAMDVDFRSEAQLLDRLYTEGTF